MRTLKTLKFIEEFSYEAYDGWEITRYTTPTIKVLDLGARLETYKSEISDFTIQISDVAGNIELSDNQGNEQPDTPISDFIDSMCRLNNVPDFIKDKLENFVKQSATHFTENITLLEKMDIDDCDELLADLWNDTEDESVRKYIERLEAALKFLRVSRQKITEKGAPSNSSDCFQLLDSNVKLNEFTTDKKVPFKITATDEGEQFDEDESEIDQLFLQKKSSVGGESLWVEKLQYTRLRIPEISKASQQSESVETTQSNSLYGAEGDRVRIKLIEVEKSFIFTMNISALSIIDRRYLMDMSNQTNWRGMHYSINFKTLTRNLELRISHCETSQQYERLIIIINALQTNLNLPKTLLAPFIHELESAIQSTQNLSLTGKKRSAPD